MITLCRTFGVNTCSIFYGFQFSDLIVLLSLRVLGVIWKVLVVEVLPVSANEARVILSAISRFSVSQLLCLNRSSIVNADPSQRCFRRLANLFPPRYGFAAALALILPLSYLCILSAISAKVNDC